MLPNNPSGDTGGAPTVSVLMPTYKQAAFIRRALASLRAQVLTDWELIVIDDGSPDATCDVLAPYLEDRRIHYIRLERNGGLGAALNAASAIATGRYIAYLPSDDVYYPEHLAELSARLDQHPELDLAYGGVRWTHHVHGNFVEYEGPLLRPGFLPGSEVEALDSTPPVIASSPLPSGNILALVQVMHRRTPTCAVAWPTRNEVVSDTLEADVWRGLLARGVRFGYAGAVTCEWTDHPHQRHKIIAGAGDNRPSGLSLYRQFYGIRPGEQLNWLPSRWSLVDERRRYQYLSADRTASRAGKLRILLVGALGWNPERILAFEERGHELHGLWIPDAENWDTVGPLPFGNVADVPYDASWRDRVRALRPDVIYGLLNWHSLSLLKDVLDARFDAPFVFHFKEAPSFAQARGLWPALVQCLTECDGCVLINEESRAWLNDALDGQLHPDRVHILDGDPPKVDWMTDDWSPRLSAGDGEIHTVCSGRPFGLTPFERIAEAGIHVHFYGRHFHQWFPGWTTRARRTGYLHVHAAVEPQHWVRELSQYDAAWMHVFRSRNHGDLRRADWADLNLPARLGTYAAAGLPLIIADNSGSTVAIEQLARRLDVGIPFTAFEDLASRLRDRARVEQLTTNMRATRRALSFDDQVDALVAFFRRAIDQRRPRRARARQDRRAVAVH